MTWFKVDDNLAFHHKAMAAGNAAMGMWVRSGSFSASQLTDGFVPDHMVASLGTKALAAKLVAAGLWTRAKGGYQFHGWGDYQPTRESVESKRAEARERMARNRGSSGDVRANNERSSDSVTPTPTRPVPTDTAAAASGAARGGKIPLDDLPPAVLKLRDRFAALTVLHTVRFTDLTPDWLERLLPLIDRHGVDTLTDFARRTQRPTGGVSTVQGFIPTWADIAAPRVVVDEPPCLVCSRPVSVCRKANQKLAPEDRCEGTAA